MRDADPALDLARVAATSFEAGIAADVARTEAVTVAPATPLADAASLMTEHGTSHLIVVADGQPIGVVSALDIAAAIAWGGGA